MALPLEVFDPKRKETPTQQPTMQNVNERSEMTKADCEAAESSDKR